MTNNNPFPQPISEQIWEKKYRLQTPNPNIPDDQSVRDTWDRIASSCARSVPDINFLDVDFDYTKEMEQSLSLQFFEALEDFKFLPAGRIVAGAGSGRNVTLFNCYVMGTIPDSMGGIFDMLKEAALTMQQGGGIGYDFSTLRPKGAPVKGVDADASGPLTYMDVWDAMCRTILSAGSRRGAMMATMRCDHPDIEDFVTAKRDPLRLRMFNVSVLVTDLFMHMVETDQDWPLLHEVAPAKPVEWKRAGITSTMVNDQYVYKVIKARDLWNLIMENTYNYAEPGVIFIDRINSMNNLWYAETISATNPCGEQPLPPYGACLLGSINLTKFVRKPFTEHAFIDKEGLEETIKTAVQILDSVIDISLFPIPQQKIEAKYKRRMGIGVTGVADMLLMCGLTYGSDASLNLLDRIMKDLAIWAYEESIELAKIYGPCPATETLEQRQKFTISGFMRNMPDHIRNGVISHGIRNSHLMSIAPTGTISLYAGNISSGIEPIFAKSYTRKILNDDGTKREERVEDYAVKLYREFCENNSLPLEDHPALVTAQDLPPDAHIHMQAVAQKWVDSSISKTINLPEDISFDDFKEVYMKAFQSGCKGCTTYRPNAVTGSVLSVDEKPKEQPLETKPELPSVALTGRPDALQGATYKVKTGGSEHAMYVSMTYVIEDGKKRPFEVFMNSKNMEHFAWTVALTRMISAIFRRGGDVSFVVEELKAVFDPRGGSWIKGRYVPSDAAAIGGIIEQFMKEIDYLPSDAEIVPAVEPTEVSIERVELCPKCHSSNMKNESGCLACLDCGHSKCG
jgi:ribonucleoside-diphosphate reductase alpha chain